MTTTTREVSFTTRLAWTAGDVRNRTKQSDDTQCYLALFVGEKCQSPGAVYVLVPICCWILCCKIASGLVFTCAARSVAGLHGRYRVPQDWYHKHQGGKAAITRSCGKVVEDWGTKGGHSAYVDAVSFSLNIAGRAEYVADFVCDHSHAPPEYDPGAVTTTTTTTTTTVTKGGIAAGTKPSAKQGAATPNAVAAGCLDTNPQCADWALQGLCDEPAYSSAMQRDCRSSCNVRDCGQTAASVAVATAPAMATATATAPGAASCTLGEYYKRGYVAPIPIPTPGAAGPSTANSQAALVKDGDVLLSINGQVAGQISYAALATLLDSLTTAKLLLVRKGLSIDVTVTRPATSARWLFDVVPAVPPDTKIVLDSRRAAAGPAVATVPRCLPCPRGTCREPLIFKTVGEKLDFVFPSARTPHGVYV